MSTHKILKYESYEKKTAEINGFLLDEGNMHGVHWMCTVTNENGNIFFLWDFDWNDAKNSVAGLKGEIKVYSWDRAAHRYVPSKINVLIKKSGGCVEQAIGKTVEECIWSDGLFYFSYDLDFELIPVEVAEPEPQVSDELVLVVEGKKLPFNKECLVSGSVYFSDLFSSNLLDKEIVVDEVKYDDMKILVSLFQPNPVIPDVSNFPKLLELAVRFGMDQVAPLAEFHLLMTDKLSITEKIVLAEKYKLETLFKKCFASLKSLSDIRNVAKNNEFSDFVKSKMFEHMLTMS